jgi:hypothetical protein
VRSTRLADNDTEARGELEALFWEYPGLAYDRKREAEKIKRLERMLKHIEAFATEYRALFPPRPKGSPIFVVEDRAGHWIATLKTQEEADQWVRHPRVVRVR